MTDPATTSRADTQPLRVLPIGEVRAAAPTPLDENTRLAARDIVDAVRTEGESGLRAFAERLDRLAPDAPLLYDRDALQRALESVDADTRALLERTAARIAAFADAQRAAIQPLDVEVPGGRAGHDVVPGAAAGCYAPGGRRRRSVGRPRGWRSCRS